MKTRFLTFALAIGVAGSAQAQFLYGISNGFGTVEDNRIYQINPANGDLTSIQQVTLPGFTVTRSLSLAADPTTGTLYAIIQASGSRRLVTIDPTTGVSTLKGTLGNDFSYLAFRSNGTLIGVTGDGAATDPETLFQINKNDGTSSLMFALGNGADGEVIAFHPNGLLYHSSGNATALFESVNVDTQVVTPIGSASGEAFAMGWHGGLGQMFLSDISSNLFTVDVTTGTRTLIGGMSDQLGGSDNRGLVWIDPVPEPTTMAALGLGALALLRRRRKA